MPSGVALIVREPSLISVPRLPAYLVAPPQGGKVVLVGGIPHNDHSALPAHDLFHGAALAARSDPMKTRVVLTIHHGGAKISEPGLVV